MIAYSRQYTKKSISDFYVSCYNWKEGSNQENFLLPRHGNAKKPTHAVYYCTDAKIIDQAKSSLKIQSAAFIYNNVNDGNDTSISCKIRNPKQL